MTDSKISPGEKAGWRTYEELADHCRVLEMRAGEWKIVAETYRERAEKAERAAKHYEEAFLAYRRATTRIQDLLGLTEGEKRSGVELAYAIIAEEHRPKP